jgi:hypothetical protein
LVRKLMDLGDNEEELKRKNILLERELEELK